MTTDERTPVLVAAQRITQRVDAPDEGRDAIGLMVDATLDALATYGAETLADRVGTIAVPRGMWPCTDPGRVVADAIGASSARTIVADVGVLQHSLITAACDAITSGRSQVEIVCGGEARWRHVLGSKSGTPSAEHPPNGEPDAVLRPDSPVVSSYEIERGVVMPATQYAMVASAYAHAAGWTDDDLSQRLGSLWAGYAAVAADDAGAWDRSAPDASTIVTPSPSNRMVSAPFTKLLCSQWNVDQSASLVFASVAAARAAGVSSDHWVFPVAAAESNAMIPMPQRREIHRWPAFRLAAKAALDLGVMRLASIDAFEIYSCFPSAVLVQLNELGLAPEAPLTVTGGMTFGGGPLNNFVLQSTVAMAERIRDGRATNGMVTGVSGMLTKPGVTVWSRQPSPSGFHSADVTAETYKRTATRPMATNESGRARVGGVTVADGRELALLELADGSQMIGANDLTGTHVGDEVLVSGPGEYRRG